MVITRRNLIGVFAASGATALAGCGGGGDGYDDFSTRFLRVLNLNPEFAAIDIAVDEPVVVRNVPFETLSPPIELAFGTYRIGVLNRATGRALYSDVVVDDFAPSLKVFYRFGSSALLESPPLGIVNYFDSNVSLFADLSAEPNGPTESSELAFRVSAPQVSRSRECRLLLSRVNDNVLVYDSGTRLRTDSILIYPDGLTGLVGAIGVNYTYDTASAVVWRNIL